jgi:hypothetical protein
MIYTFSRDMIESGIDLVEPYALISISTQSFSMRGDAQKYQEDNHPAKLPADEFRLDILRLAFWDVDRIDPQWPDRVKAQAILFSPQQAAQVAYFVKGWGVNFVIHCDAGISRSQGMANAISDHFDVDVKHSTKGAPNSHVYRLTWEALRPGDVGIPPAELAARAWAGSLKTMRPDVTLPQVTKRGGDTPNRTPDKYRIRYSDDKGGE